MEIKYTQDGKKVVVVGELNQKEKIVQEVFLTENGDEIAQGDRFVERNLLDTPLKSWKETKLEQLEEKFESEKREWDSKIEKVISAKRLVYRSLSARVEWLEGVAGTSGDAQFTKALGTLISFLDGSDKWVFVDDYYKWSLEKFSEDGVNEIFESHERRHGDTVFDSMRLLSLHGRSDGNLAWRVNEYSDTSGTNKEVEFFKSYEDALTYLQERVNLTGTYTQGVLENAEKFNLKLDPDKLAKYKDGIKENVLSQIKKLDCERTRLEGLL